MDEETQNPGTAGRSIWDPWIDPDSGPKADADRAVRLEQHKLEQIKEQLDYGVELGHLSKNQSEELLRKYNEYETELTGKSYEELSTI